jgi:hypothetical protein
MSESPTTKTRRDASTVALALLCSAVLAVVVGAGALFWKQLEQSRADNAALANQVRSLGGQPVAEGKPGQPGNQGPMGPQGPRGFQGPPGAQGKQGPIGITGRSPACLLEPSRCVGPKGATGETGAQGSKGDTGPEGAQGDTGPAGTDGKDGATGLKGDQGIQGERGATGDTGPQGPAGPTCPKDSELTQQTFITAGTPPGTITAWVCTATTG